MMEPGTHQSLSDIRSGVLYDMTTDAAWMVYRASKDGVSRQKVVHYARRQELRMLLLGRELDTLGSIEFARYALSDFEALP
jgi:hypothetical protein